MGYNYDAARKAGFSDEEILEELSGKLNYNLGKARDAGFKDEDILKELVGKSGSIGSGGKPVETAPVQEESPEGRGILGNIQAGFEYATGTKLFPSKEDIQENPDRAAMDIVTSPLRVLAAAPAAVKAVVPGGQERNLQETADMDLPELKGTDYLKALANPVAGLGPRVALGMQKRRAQEKIREGYDPESTEDVPARIFTDPNYAASTLAAVAPPVFLSMIGSAAIESLSKAGGMKPYNGKDRLPEDLKQVVGEWTKPYREAVQQKSLEPIRKHWMDNPEMAVFDLGILVGGVSGGKRIVNKVQYKNRKRALQKDLGSLDGYAKTLGDRLSKEEYQRSLDAIMDKHGVSAEATAKAKEVMADVAPEVDLGTPAYLRKQAKRESGYVPSETPYSISSKFTHKPSDKIVKVGGTLEVPEVGTWTTAESPLLLGTQIRPPEPPTTMALGEGRPVRLLGEPGPSSLTGEAAGEGFTVRDRPRTILRKREPDFLAVETGQRPPVEYKSKKGSDHVTARRFAPDQFSKDVKAYVLDLRDQVKEGSPGGRFFNYDAIGKGGSPEVTGYGSTYPTFMRDSGWSKETVLKALDKGIRGDKLGQLQQRIWNSALDEARKTYVDQYFDHFGEYPKRERGLEKYVPEDEPKIGNDFGDVFEFDKAGKPVTFTGKVKKKLSEETGAFTLPRKPTARERKNLDAMKRLTKQRNRAVVESVRQAKIPEMPPETIARAVTDLKHDAVDPLAKAYQERETATPQQQGQRVRKAVDGELFTPVEGNDYSKAAVNYVKTGDIKKYLSEMPETTGQEGKAVTLGKSPAIEAREIPPERYQEIADSKVPDIDNPRRKLESIDIRRNIQTIDGGDFGPISEHVLLPTRDTIMARDSFSSSWKGRMEDVFVRNSIAGRKAQKSVWEVLDGQRKVAKPNEMTAAVEIRKELDALHSMMNEARAKRGQQLIPYRNDYVTYIAERTWLDKLKDRAEKPDWVLEGPGAPDFINPNKPFNPRELARTAPYESYFKNKRLGHLMLRYIDKAANDIFYTNAIQNIKGHTKALRENGRPNAAWLIEQWGSRALAGIQHPFDVWVDAAPGLIRESARFQRWVTKGLKRSVFPANIAWNIGIQTTSHVALAPVTNLSSMVKAAPLMFSPKHRAIVKQSYVYHQKTRSQTQYATEWGESLKRFKALEKPGILNTVGDKLNYLTGLIERELTTHAGITAYLYGKKKGMDGRRLLSFMDDTMQRVNSLYNHADLPGILQSKNVSAAVPFQTFVFEGMNNLREMAGKTGNFKVMNQQKIRRLLEFAAGAYVANAVTQAALGRSPWEWESFVPFATAITAMFDSGGRYGRAGATTGVAYATDAWKAFNDYVETGNMDKARKLFLRYHVPAGTQINRIIEADRAWGDDGRVRDRGGKTQFQMDPDQKAKSYLVGPWATEQGVKASEERFSAYLEDVPEAMRPILPMIPGAKTAVEMSRKSRKASGGMGSGF